MDPLAAPNLLDDPEGDLFRKAREGDFAAYEALVARLQGRVFGLARRITGQEQDAEDVVQQTFLSVIEHIRDFREESRVATWILRIAANHALKILRKRRGMRTVPLETEGSDGDTYASIPHPDFIANWRDNPENLAQRGEVNRILMSAMDELDEKYRVVFVLRDIEGLSIKETAEMIGISEANVKIRLLRARLLLREKFTRIFGDESSRVIPDHGHG
jgi:RNA polymerase sigma-70 factor, ECF subfamily